MRRSIRAIYLILLLAMPLLAYQAAHAQENGRAALVIVTGEDAPITRCVDLDQPTISGERLLALSGLDFVSDPQSSMGATVCSIDGVGCNHPAEDCFCRCQGSPCTYWSYWRLDDSEQWLYSGLGAASAKVTAGAVEGWVWGDGSSGTAPEPPALRFDDICAPEAAVDQPVATRTASAEETLAAEVAVAMAEPAAGDFAQAPAWQRMAGIAVVVAIPILILVLQRWRRLQ